MPKIDDPLASASGPQAEEGRRPTTVAGPLAASPELLAVPRRRTFTIADKLRILAETDAAVGSSGGVSAVLRREGLYSSMLSEWRRQRKNGALQALIPVKRGPKVAPTPALAGELAAALRDNARLQLRLDRAEAIIEIQKKVAELLGTPLPTQPLPVSDETR